MFSLLRALLGAEVDVAASLLYADPHLPEWLPEFRLEGLRVGERIIDLRVWRDGDRTQIEIAGGDGVKLVRRPMVDALDTE